MRQLHGRGERGNTELLAQGAKSIPRNEPLIDLRVSPVNRQLKVLVIEDTSQVLEIYLNEILKIPGVIVCSCRPVESVHEATALAMREMPDLVITDISLTPNHHQGFAIVPAIRRICPDAIIAISSSMYSPDSHDEFNERARQAADFVIEKADLRGLRQIIETAQQNLGCLGSN